MQRVHMADADRVARSSHPSLVRPQGTSQTFSVLVPSRSSLAVPGCSIARYRHESGRNISLTRSHRPASSTSIPSSDVAALLLHMSKTRLQKPTRTAPLSRSTPLPKPTTHTTNGSHIHSHTFRSRILHTGTLYLLSPPTSVSYTHL